jgi:prenyltransferase beta subunit
MKIEIEIDENYITELVSQEIAKRIVAERGYENREAKSKRDCRSYWLD